MIIQFPDLVGQEKKTLFIIGNGFDLYHNIPSTYEHFKCWLYSNGQEEFVCQMQKFFPYLKNNGEYLLWTDFEHVLGEYNQIDLSRLISENYDRELDDDVQNLAIIKFQPIIKQIRPLMKIWAKSIDISKAKPSLQLSKESKYITFNYTKTLEDIYGIPSSQICHIHGCVDGKEELVVGHNHSKDEDNEIDDYFMLEKVRTDIIKTMNNMVKDCNTQERLHYNFFNSLKDISHVVILGHSLSDIDSPYFFKIMKSIACESNWHFSKHDVNGDKSIDDFLKKKELSFPYHDIKINRWIFNF